MGNPNGGMPGMGIPIIMCNPIPDAVAPVAPPAIVIDVDGTGIKGDVVEQSLPEAATPVGRPVVTVEAEGTAMYIPGAIPPVPPPA